MNTGANPVRGSDFPLGQLFESKRYFEPGPVLSSAQLVDVRAIDAELERDGISSHSGSVDPTRQLRLSRARSSPCSLPGLSHDDEFLFARPGPSRIARKNGEPSLHYKRVRL
jgi:hypothetical protein